MYTSLSPMCVYVYMYIFDIFSPPLLSYLSHKSYCRRNPLFVTLPLPPRDIINQPSTTVPEPEKQTHYPNIHNVIIFIINLFSSKYLMTSVHSSWFVLTM